MKLRYELIDREHPTWRGPRFTDRARAERELRQAIPPGRFYIKDRLPCEPCGARDGAACKRPVGRACWREAQRP